MFAAKSAAPLGMQGDIRRSVFKQAAETPFTLFIAPPGYLLGESLAATLIERIHPLLWLRVGPEDRDPAVFLFSLIAAAQRLRAGIGLSTLDQMQKRPGPVFGWPPLFIHLTQELSESLPAGTAIVLEHVHHLNNAQPVLGLLGAHFLSRLPPTTPCILTAANRLPSTTLPTNTTVRGINDLRLDTQSGLVLARNAEVGLSGDSIRRAISLIGGQAVTLAGLLAACASLGSSFLQQTINRSKNANQLLSQVARASLAAAEPETLRALAVAIHIEYSHPEMVQAIGGSQVVPSGPWIQPLADRWARVRRVWQAPLKTALHTEIESNYAALHRTADYLIEHEETEHAIRMYLELGDLTSAAWIIAGVADRMMDLGQWETLAGWLNRLPAEVFQDWPGLLYIQGELAAAGGHTHRAQGLFSTATSLFSKRHEHAGACQSLLAESALAAWENDPDRALASAFAANALAAAAGLSWYQGWAAWQLGRLASGSVDLDHALGYFSQASLEIKEPFFTEMFQQVEALALNQRDLRRQAEFHRQAYFHAEQDEQDAGDRLQTLLNSPPENLPAVLSSRGWSGLPLLLKLPAPNKSIEPGASLEKSSPWQDLLSHLRSYRYRHTQPGDDSSALALPLLFPSASGNESKLSPPLSAVGDKLANNTDTSSFSASLIPQTAGRNAAPGPHRLLSHSLSSQNEIEVQVESRETLPHPALTVHLFGAFRISMDDRPIEKLPGSRALAVLKYLLVHKGQEIARDVLMDVFWPEAAPEAARNNLNVALYHLRRSFRQVSKEPVILYDKNKGSYSLNPELEIWSDIDEFDCHIKAARQLDAGGQLFHALREYEIAASLYQGSFLSDDLYEEWTITTRERFRMMYLEILDRLCQIYFSQGQYSACITLCQQILERDNCREDAHRRLMRCYNQQGQRHLALRQFQICVKALRSELDVDPEQSTVQLYERIRRHEQV